MMTSSWKTIINELNQADIEVTRQELDLIFEHNRIFLAGAGRSQLALKAFAMRLTQVGKEVYVYNSETTPAFLKNDVLVIASGSATTPSMLSLVKKAKEIDGVVWLLTAAKQTEMTQLADVKTTLPCKSKFDYETNQQQPLGSLFEQSVWIYGDAFIIDYMQQQQIDEQFLANRHNNLE